MYMQEFIFLFCIIYLYLLFIVYSALVIKCLHLLEIAIFIFFFGGGGI